MGYFDGGGGPPSVSWKGAVVGSKVKGVQAEPLRTQQATEMGKPGEPAKPKFFNGPNGQPDLNAPIMQGVLVLQTEWRNWEACSAVFKARALAEGLEDDGQRRLFLTGGFRKPTTDRAARDALRAAKHRGDPEVGSTWVFEVTNVEPSSTGADIKSYAATYTPPTPETLALVGASAAGSGWAGAEPEREPVGSFAGAAPADEPPF